MQRLCDIPDLLTIYELLSNYSVVKVHNHIIGHTLPTMFLKINIIRLLIITKLILSVACEKEF